MNPNEKKKKPPKDRQGEDGQPNTSMSSEMSRRLKKAVEQYAKLREFPRELITSCCPRLYNTYRALRPPPSSKLEQQNQSVNGRPDSIKPIVKTGKGRVRGIRCSDADVKDESMSKEYVSFYRIPTVLFEKFMDADDDIFVWPGVLDCTTQFEIEGSEIKKMSYAYVNVYTKNLPDPGRVETKKRKDPVMVFVPGEYGTSDDLAIFHGPQFLLREDVVVVVVGYRTGILGNLQCTDSPKGHQGLSDLTGCLRWVRDEIKLFGGHPDNITCFGQGDGAAALWTILTCDYGITEVEPDYARGDEEEGEEVEEEPEELAARLAVLAAKPLFHKLILQSSTATSRHWVSKLTAKEFGLLTGLGGGKDDDHLNSLTKSDLDVIRNLEKRLPMKPVYRMIEFGATTYLQEDLFKYQVPVLIGFNSNEYHYDKSIYDDIDSDKDSILDTLGHHYIRDEDPIDDDAKYYEKLDRDELVDKIKSEFYNNEPATQEKFEQVTQDLHHNIGVLCQAKELALRMAPTKKVYLYKFNGNTHLNLYKSQQLGQMDVPGASFGDELGYLFKTHGTEEIVPNSREEILRDRMVAMWTNFARFGCPVTSNADGNKMFGMRARWKGIKTREFDDKTKIRKHVLGSMYGVEIGDELVYKELPEVERMKKWWNIMVGCDNWFDI